MRTRAILSGALTSLTLVASGCGTAPEPVIVREPVEVLIKVPMPCPIDVPTTDGPDFAPADSKIEWAAIYAQGRIIALRAEVESLRAAAAACDAAAADQR